jgi:hypothetical protein
MTLADVYDTYSSSAQASQSLLRNLMGATFVRRLFFPASKLPSDADRHLLAWTGILRCLDVCAFLLPTLSSLRT